MGQSSPSSDHRRSSRRRCADREGRTTLRPPDDGGQQWVDARRRTSSSHRCVQRCPTSQPVNAIMPPKTPPSTSSRSKPGAAAEHVGAQARPGWSRKFRRSTMGPHIWSTQSLEVVRLVERLDLSMAGFRGGPGLSPDVRAIAFLDGGYLSSGAGWGQFAGRWIIGIEAMAWVCDRLGIRPPKELRGFDPDVLNRKMERQRRNPKRLMEASRELRSTNKSQLLAALPRVREILDRISTHPDDPYVYWKLAYDINLPRPKVKVHHVEWDNDQGVLFVYVSTASRKRSLERNTSRGLRCTSRTRTVTTAHRDESGAPGRTTTVARQTSPHRDGTASVRRRRRAWSRLTRSMNRHEAARTPERNRRRRHHCSMDDRLERSCRDRGCSMNVS
jgi:hypothetical protein